MALSAKWFQWAHTQEEQAKLEEMIRNSRTVLDLLTRVLEKELQEKEAVSEASYDKPSWANWQADRNGAVRTLKNLLTLTKL